MLGLFGDHPEGVAFAAGRADGIHVVGVGDEHPGTYHIPWFDLSRNSVFASAVNAKDALPQ